MKTLLKARIMMSGNTPVEAGHLGHRYAGLTYENLVSVLGGIPDVPWSMEPSKCLYASQRPAVNGDVIIHFKVNDVSHKMPVQWVVFALTKSAELSNTKKGYDIGLLCGDKRCLLSEHMVLEPRAWAKCRLECDEDTWDVTKSPIAFFVSY